MILAWQPQRYVISFVFSCVQFTLQFQKTKVYESQIFQHNNNNNNILMFIQATPDLKKGLLRSLFVSAKWLKIPVTNYTQDLT